MTLNELLDGLERESRPAIKEQMLREMTEPGLVLEAQEFFKLALDPEIKFGVTYDERKMPPMLEPSRILHYDIVDELKTLQYCKTREEKLQMINQIVATGGNERKWFVRAVNKNLRNGVTDTIINKIWPGHIRKFECMLAHDEPPKMIEVASSIIEPKYDGERCLIFCQGGGVTGKGFSRNGKAIKDENIRHILDHLEAHHFIGVLDGEMLARNWNQTAAAVRGPMPMPDELRFHVFDHLTLAEWSLKQSPMLHERRERLYQLAAQDVLNTKNEVHATGPINLVPHRVLESLDDAKRYAKEWHDLGFEGGIVKDLYAPYEWERSRSWRKMKFIITADGPIIGYEEGTGRNAGRLGAFIILYRGEQVKVGAGLTDEQRESLWLVKDDLIAKKVWVEFEAQDESKSGMQAKVRFPVFVRLRESKMGE